MEKKKKKAFLVLEFFRRPGSYEVFLLSAGVLGPVVLVGVLSRRQLPRCPVGAFVVAQIPVQQEGHNHQRQHNDGNDHWGDKTEEFKDNRGSVTSGNVGERELYWAFTCNHRGVYGGGGRCHC